MCFMHTCIPGCTTHTAKSSPTRRYVFDHFYVRKASADRLVLTLFIQTYNRMLKSAEYFMAGFFGLEWYDYLRQLVGVDILRDVVVGHTMPLSRSLSRGVGSTTPSQETTTAKCPQGERRAGRRYHLDRAVPPKWYAAPCHTRASWTSRLHCAPSYRPPCHDGRGLGLDSRGYICGSDHVPLRDGCIRV